MHCLFLYSFLLMGFSKSGLQPVKAGVSANVKYTVYRVNDMPGKSAINKSTLNSADTSGPKVVTPAALSASKKGFKIKKDSVKTKDGSLNSEITYTAKDSTNFNIPGKKVYLYRDAVVKYDDVVLKAGFVEMNQTDFTIFASGFKDSSGHFVQKPVVTEGQTKITADSLRYNFKTRKTIAWEGVSGEGGGFIRGGKIKLNESKEGFLKNGIYTTCNLDHPHYGIKITRAKINKNTIVTGPVYFFVEDVPIPLILPFGFFPKTDRRANGILFPRIGEDQQLGFFLQDFGYYQGLGENFDAEMRGSIYSKGSYGVRIDSRYNFIYKSSGNISFTFNNRKTGDLGTSNYAKSNDFNLTWSHSQSEKSSPGSTFSASVNAASSSYFKNTTLYYNINSRAQNSIGSSINYSRIWEGTPFSMNLAATHSQNLATHDVSLTFPNFNFAVTRINPFDPKDRVGAQKWYQKIAFSYTVQVQNSITTKDSLLFKKNVFKRFSNGILHQPSISLGTYNVLKYLLVSPSAAYTERWYFQTYRQRYNFSTRVPDRDTVQGFRTQRDFSFNIGTDTRIYGLILFKKGSIIQGIRHVFEPQISFQYTPDFRKISPKYYGKYYDFGLHRTSVYSVFDGGLFGGPPNQKSESMGVNLNNILEMKVRSKKDTTTGTIKIPILERLNISGFYNFVADSMRLSNINIVGGTTLFKKVTINFNFLLDPYATDKYGYDTRFYLFQRTHQLARLTTFNFTANASLNPSAATKKNAAAPEVQRRQQLFEGGSDPVDFVDFKIPWNLNLSYNFNYSVFPGSPGGIARRNYSRTDIANFTGSLTVTPKWNVTFTSGIDLAKQTISATQLGFTRDLHCWQLTMSWIPFGAYKYYSIELRVKSGFLQDLKLNKRKEYYYDQTN